MKIDYRINGAPAGYTSLADEDTPATTQDKISAYKPSLRASPQNEPLAVGIGQAFASLITGRSGQWTLSFAVDRQHANAGAALLFLQAHPTLFSVSGQYDLRITVGTQIVYLPACAITGIEPDDHSDQHTFIKYSFIGGSYTTNAP